MPQSSLAVGDRSPPKNRLGGGGAESELDDDDGDVLDGSDDVDEPNSVQLTAGRGLGDSELVDDDGESGAPAAASRRWSFVSLPAALLRRCLRGRDDGGDDGGASAACLAATVAAAAAGAGADDAKAAPLLRGVPAAP